MTKNWLTPTIYFFFFLVRDINPLCVCCFQKENSSEKQIQLSGLDFAASGWYSCSVSMETPIYSKDSEMKALTVIGMG